MLGDRDDTGVLLDAVQAAAGNLTIAARGDHVDVGVPLPGRVGRSVTVRIRPCGDAWLLDDGGAVAGELGERAAGTLDALRAAGTELSLVDGAVTCGPWEQEELPPAVLRFAMELGFLPTVAAVTAHAHQDAALAAVVTADRGTSARDLWADDAGDWGTESLRESAQQFQEDSLRRWAG